LAETTELNPREKIGGNLPPIAAEIARYEGDFAAVTTAFLAEEYAKQPQIVAALMAEATALMRDENGELKKIEDDETKDKVKSLIKRIRDANKVLEAAHSKEKQPYLRGGQAVDQWFFGMMDKCVRRAKGNRAGAADILNDELTDYDTRLLEAERERRRKVAEEEAEKARKGQAEADRLAREARERQAEADRARKPQTVEQKQGVAAEVAAAASEAKVEAAISASKAEAAHVDTLAKPADIMRSRGADGTLSTMATEPYAVVEDEALLDKEALWPFVPLDAKEQAFRAWAKTNGYSKQMAGGKCGRKPKSLVK
jgi:hypothetical protein